MTSIGTLPVKKGKATQISQHVADVLIEERVVKRGMTQRAFAELLGVSFQQYQKYEKGKDRISLEKAMVLCDKLSISLEVFREQGDISASGLGETPQTNFGHGRVVPSPKEQALLAVFSGVPKKQQDNFLEMVQGLANVMTKNRQKS